MKILTLFWRGLGQTAKTKRMILFAWFINVIFALVLALPVLNTLDRYTRDTVMEERLLQHMDPAWMETLRLDLRSNELMRFVDYTIFGYAPFLSHLESALSGRFIKAVGTFLSDLIFSLEVRPGRTSILVLLGLLYVGMTCFLAGGFISIYGKDYRSSFTEFLTDGAKYFGRFFRLALLALIVYYLVFTVLLDWLSSGIPRWTQQSPSEETPFLYYLLKAVFALLLLSVLAMIFDYARIRIVVDMRTSALLASLAGARFAIRNFGHTYGLYLLLGAVGVLLIVIYAFLEAQLPQNSYWPLVLVFLLQQLYMVGRVWLKAGFYSCQTRLYRSQIQQEIILQPLVEASPTP